MPYVLMHMRGDPTSMQSLANTAYDDVCAEVGDELQIRAEAAINAGIEPWRLILDPGKSLSFFSPPRPQCVGVPVQPGFHVCTI